MQTLHSWTADGVRWPADCDEAFRTIALIVYRAAYCCMHVLSMCAASHSPVFQLSQHEHAGDKVMGILPRDLGMLGQDHVLEKALS